MEHVLTEVWKIMFHILKWVICRICVNLPGFTCCSCTVAVFSSHKEGIELPRGFHSSPFTYQSEPNKAQGKLLDSEDIKMAG